jgi:hypothetical protein
VLFLSAVGAALTAYQAALTAGLQHSTPSEQDILSVLRSRDELQAALAANAEVNGHQLHAIHTLDRQLKGQAVAWAQVLDFSTYRQSFSPKSAEQWWWWLDQAAYAYDWVFQGLTTLSWATSIGLLVTISGRFLFGGAGVGGISAIALSNLIALLKARSDLTAAGNAGFKQFLEGVKVPPLWRSRVRFGSTALLTLVLVGFWFSLPPLSRWYNAQGQGQQDAGEVRVSGAKLQPGDFSESR